MRLMAQHNAVEPTRISFHTTKHAIVGALNAVHLARAGVVPAQLRRLLDEVYHFVLPPHRRHRTFPRKCPSKKCQSGLN